MSSSLSQILGIVKPSIESVLNLPSKLGQVLGINTGAVGLGLNQSVKDIAKPIQDWSAQQERGQFERLASKLNAPQMSMSVNPEVDALQRQGYSTGAAKLAVGTNKLVGAAMGMTEPIKNVGNARVLFHGTNANVVGRLRVGKNGKSVLGEGVYLTKSADEASAYGKNIIETSVPDNLNLFKGQMLEVRRAIKSDDPKKITDYLISKGFDGVERPDEIVIFNPKNIFKQTKADPLLQEARKYKTAEEFVKAQKPVFRGGIDLSEGAFGEGAGISVTPDIEVAKIHRAMRVNQGDEGVALHTLHLDPRAKIATVKDVPKNIATNPGSDFENVVSWAKLKGYDAVDLNAMNDGIILTNRAGKEIPETEIRILNQDILKTKSQLLDIWKKANKLD